MQETIKCAVVGCGHIGRRHADLIDRHPATELVALCDIRTPEECGMSDMNVPFFHTIYNLLRSDIPIDVIHICTPNGLHAQQAMDALANDFHVVIEKPMALTSADCEKIISLSHKRKKHIFCVMQNRFSPPAAWLKGVLESQVLGQIYFAGVNCFWNRDKRYYINETWHGTSDLDGGTLYTQFSHFVDTVLWLFGPITEIKANFGDFNHAGLTDFEDSGVVTFEFVNGGLGNFNYSTAVADENYESSITVIGEHGVVKIGGQYMDKVEFCRIRNYTMPELAPTSPANDYGSFKGSASNHHLLIQNIVDVLQHGAPIATTAEEGMLVVKTIEQIYSQRPPHLYRES